uniref:Uncharacterized protein n=1 Tax=Arundo donax TaxID=35708 RepID=A0A0A9GZ72_ARUDO
MYICCQRCSSNSILSESGLRSWWDRLDLNTSEPRRRSPHRRMGAAGAVVHPRQRSAPRDLSSRSDAPLRWRAPISPLSESGSTTMPWPVGHACRELRLIPMRRLLSRL